MTFTEGMIIEGYEDLQSKIPLIEKDKSKRPLYLLFTGSDGPDGNSWCPDCVDCNLINFKVKLVLKSIHN